VYAVWLCAGTKDLVSNPATSRTDGGGRIHPIFQKLQRPYLNRTLNTRRRFQALKQHYQFVVAQFSPGRPQEFMRHQAKCWSCCRWRNQNSASPELQPQEKEGAW